MAKASPSTIALGNHVVIPLRLYEKMAAVYYAAHPDEELNDPPPTPPPATEPIASGTAEPTLATMPTHSYGYVPLQPATIMELESEANPDVHTEHLDPE